MKIAFLIGVNDVGGAEFVSYHHVMMAYRNGFDVTVLSGTAGKFHDLIKLAGVKIEVVTMNPAPHFVSRLLQWCDIVFNCNFFQITPIVIELKKRIKFRYLAIIHSDINWVYDQMARHDVDTDGYYAIHQKIKDEFVRKGLMAADKFSVIPNCVDNALIGRMTGEQEKMRLKFGFNDGDFVIGMITRVAVDKNILDAVKILSSLQPSINARLLIVGGPCATPAGRDYYEKVKRLTKTICGGKFQNRISITGNLDTEDVYKTMQAFDIGLNCSPSEGLPIALLEMMGAGIPCVMPGIGDIPDVLTGRGIVVPIRQRLEIKEILAEPCYSNVEILDFVKAISYLYQHKEDLPRIGSAASKYINEFRSLKFQEKLFLNFIGMKKKTEVGTLKTEEKSGASDTAIELIEKTIEGLTEEPLLIESVSELPKVSVLMPIRDGNEEWIELAIESIVNQDYAGQIELLVINHDCRLSLTAIIDRIIGEKSSQKIPIACLVVKDVTLQFSEVLDFGIGYCTGVIIVRMDCDDIAEPNLVSKLAEFMQKNTDIDVCGVQLHFFGAKDIITNHPARITRKIAYEIQGTWFVNHPGVAIRKSALLSVGGYGKTKTGFAEDYRLWCKILKAGGVIANLPDALIKYRCYQKDWRYSEGHAEFLQKEKSGLKG